jgi:hypothetical protein
MNNTNAHNQKRSGHLYHYTPWAKLPAIIQSGELRPSAAGAEHERPLLWFSAHPVWEPTATKLLVSARGVRRMDFEEMEERFGAVRFLLPADDPRLMDWPTACRYAGTPFADRVAMERSGRMQGAYPSQWFALKCPVAVEALTLQVWLEDAWHRADAVEMAQAWAEVRGMHGEAGWRRSK